MSFLLEDLTKDALRHAGELLENEEIANRVARFVLAVHDLSSSLVPASELSTDLAERALQNAAEIAEGKGRIRWAARFACRAVELSELRDTPPARRKEILTFARDRCECAGMVQDVSRFERSIQEIDDAGRVSNHVLSAAFEPAPAPG